MSFQESSSTNATQAEMARITVLPSSHHFESVGAETILEGALRASVPLNYGCSGGSCGLCKAKVVSGEIKKTRFHDYVRTEADKRDGMVLMCSNSAVGEVVIEASVAGGAEEIPLQQISATVKSITVLTPEMALLHLRTPRTSRLRFLAGQSAILTVNQAYSAILSIASCPCDDHNIFFHVRRTANNAFADYVFNQLKNNEVVEIEGPKGHFLFHENGNRPLCFFAFDTGFAPIKSLIEHAVSLDAGVPIFLYWIGSTENSIYLPNVGRAWADALDSFYFSPIVANFDVANFGNGQEDSFDALLHDVKQQRPELAESNVYIAGPAAAINKAHEYFLNAGVPSSQV
ncbi:MAG: 2Fe-2S iron-sulfur cluster-binding protein, partial [Gallionellaceae bacterium]|nr:2Fe-2S iron-sulfur cluster-binding protein [Gallionellaceae bacterium]